MSMTRQKGFGIAELLIGIAVGMIVVGAAVQMLFTTLRSSNDSIKMARLDQDLRQTMQMVSRDLRRATSWDAATDAVQVSMAIPLTLSANSGTATVSTSKADSPGINHLVDLAGRIVGGTLIHVDSDGNLHRGEITAYDGSAKTYTVSLAGTWPATVKSTDGVAKGSWGVLRPQSVISLSGNCVLFVLDQNLDGAYGNDEYFGYKLDGNAVKIRFSGSDSVCANGSWEKITDDNFVVVNNFSVTENTSSTLGSSGLTVSIREYTISITGELKSDSSVKRTLQETIRVRNDSVS